jgi:tRNA dimethylallyltransferase
VEIVAVDAFTIYRGMDIATAKPSQEEREEVAHHLVDVLDPAEEVSVAWFQAVARRAVDAIHERGALPLLVGGSGLYFHAVVDDLRFPPTDPAVRARIRRRYEDDPPAAHRALEATDPEAAARIDPNNLRRSVRALEVIALTGEAFSSFGRGWDEHRSVYPGLEVRGLDLQDPDLRRRIGRRAERMVAEGLVAEAERLRRPPGGLSRTARQAIGYREAFAVLDGDLGEDELAEAIAQRTWRYARRQRSWFRRDPRIAWGRPDDLLNDWAP